MGPARAMGIFLRTWRGGWARLTRAQVALAVSALCARRKPITPDIIREWEDGQPPKTSAELNALLDVMRRNGLTEAEAEQFRQAIFASCLNRQYPELFEGDDLAHRSDVEAVAYGTWQRQEQASALPNIVSLVAGISELEEAMKSGLRPTCPGSPARKQAVALTYLRATLVKLHGLSNRFTEVVRAASANAELLDAHFGPGGLGEQHYLCGLGQRFMQEERGIGRRPDSFRRLVGLAGQAMKQGQVVIARHSMCSAMECLGNEPDASLDALCYHWQEVLGHPFSLAEPADDNPWNRRHLLRACLHAGELGMAEEHLLGLLPWRDDKQVRGCVWHICAGALAMQQGRHDEAADALHAGLENAIENGFVRARTTIEAHLAKCEEATQRALRSKGRAKTA